MMALQTPREVMGKQLHVANDDLFSLVYGAEHDARNRIVVRCGVERPAALQATSRCDVVNDIGWFSEQLEDRWRFTTIGRRTTVEVQVGADLEPAADALVDLTPMVKLVPQTKPCQ